MTELATLLENIRKNLDIDKKTFCQRIGISEYSYHTYIDLGKVPKINKVIDKMERFVRRYCKDFSISNFN